MEPESGITFYIIDIDLARDSPPDM